LKETLGVKPIMLDLDSPTFPKSLLNGYEADLQALQKQRADEQAKRKAAADAEASKKAAAAAKA
jgi:hypothetical protein